MKTLMWQIGASEEENSPPPLPGRHLQVAWSAHQILLLQMSQHFVRAAEQT